MNPEVGEIWQWDGGPYVLLLMFEETIFDADYYKVLDLSDGGYYSMAFKATVNHRWTRIA